MAAINRKAKLSKMPLMELGEVTMTPDGALKRFEWSQAVVLKQDHEDGTEE
jgi:hypothetical protein